MDVVRSLWPMRENDWVNTSPGQVRSAYLRPSNVGLVFLGGTFGVFAREILMIAVPGAGAVPVAVLLANVVGAILLGLLLEALESLGPESPRSQNLRLLLGTGVLGGFTTYSALVQGMLVLWAHDDAWLAIAYGGGTLLFGGIATWAGVWLGASLRRRGGDGDSDSGSDRARGDHG